MECAFKVNVFRTVLLTPFFHLPSVWLQGDAETETTQTVWDKFLN